MKHQKRRQLLVWRLMVGIVLFWFVLLTATMLMTTAHTSRTYAEKVDSNLLSTVKSLAESPGVIESVESGNFRADVAEFITSLVQNTDDLDYVSICDRDSIRLYHLFPDFIGHPFLGDDQARALAGESYFSDAQPVGYDAQRRAFYPVRSGDGTVIGFVMACTNHERLNEIRSEIMVNYSSLFLVLTGLTLAVSLPMAVFLGRYLRGVRTEDLLRIYLTQNDIINALDEGLISFDNGGRIRLVNAAAERMLGQREDLLLGRQVDDILRASDGSSLRDRDQKVFQSNRANILAQPIRLPNSNLWARQVLILADESELARYAEELGGSRHMVSTLRANTHEFLNKLQVISGLLQMERIDEAKAYIGTIAADHERISGPVMKQIRNSGLAALILGKAANMRELDIDMILMRNSSIPEQSRYLGTNELVTVVGNLLENSIEAVNALPADRERGIVLQVTEDDNGLLIMVSDSGVGIPADVLPHIYETGFSTKARTGRGVGMRLVKDITDRCGGTIEVDTEPGFGTTISIIINRERGESL